MKNIGFVSLAIFFIFASIGLFVWWCSGFNFDRRGDDVAMAASLILTFSIGSSVMFYVCAGGAYDD